MDKKIQKKLIRHLVTHTIFSIVAIGAIGAGLVWLIWMWFFFFPNDYEVSAQQAALSGEKGSSRIMLADLVRDIDSLQITGPSAATVISAQVDILKKDERLIKPEEYSTALKRYMLFRVGTGKPGVWVDERSSIMLAPGASLLLGVPANASHPRLETAVLAFDDRALLEIQNNGQIENLKPGNGQQVFDRAFAAQSGNNNRGFPLAMAETGWIEKKLECQPGAGIVLRNNGEAPLFLGNPRITAQSEEPRRPNVIYLVFDGVATRYWSFYNEKSSLTPKMAEIAGRDFIVFDNMVGLGEKTRISTSGTFVSEIPLKIGHGINCNFIPDEERNRFYDQARKGRFTPVADVFRRAGYNTAQFGNSGFTVDLLSTGIDYGFARSYEFAHNPYDTWGISNQFFEFLRENRNNEFMVYCHYNTPHKPFYAPLKYFVTGPLKAPLEGAWRPDFMACIAYTDDVFENIFASLKNNGLLENSIIVVATDHGSGYDLDKFDGGFQYNDYTRMTWMVHVPQQVREKYNIPDDVRRVKTWLSAINIAPTLCDLAGVEPGRGFAGRSFAGVLRHDQADFFDKEIWCFGRKEYSVLTPDHFKYLLTLTDTRRNLKRDLIVAGTERERPYEQLFDVQSDPWEQNNLLRSRPDKLRAMRELVIERDLHHPERFVLAVAAGRKARVEVDMLSASPVIVSGVYDAALNQRVYATQPMAGGAQYAFAADQSSVVYLLCEYSDDRAPLTVNVRVDGVQVSREQFTYHALGLQPATVPLAFSTADDFRRYMLYNLPHHEGFSIEEGEVRFRVGFIDLHRWIDIGAFEASGISAGMKDTLRSWGYIQ